MNEKNVSRFSGIVGWIDSRLPIFSYVKDNLVDYKTPKNLNYLWNLGVMSGVSLVLQIVTGIILAMHYNPSAVGAFDSVEHIMRDVNYGWLIRYVHAVGASTFFICVYIHIFRGFYYGSYKSPRELLWMIGVVVFLLMMATAFMGYVLPWGQMSFWAATVITNIFSAIPFVGDDIVVWLLGGYAVGDPTLNRFFALHYLVPFVILGMVFLHLWALHQFGSNNPTGIDVKSEKDKIPFHPFYTVKDAVTLIVLFMVIASFVFFAPNYLGHPDNYIEADPLVTPMHIVPEWYFLPFYAMLRAIPSKIGGVIVLFGSILIWLFLPWLDSSKIRSGRFRPVFRVFYFVFVFDFFLLMYLGSREAVEPYVTLSLVATAYYFFHFLVILPLLARYEKGCLPVDIVSK